MYEDKEDKELFELLEKHHALTFQSQLDLRDEFTSRGMAHKAESLNETIRNKVVDIKNFAYLKDLGFEAEKSQNSIKVKRSTKAVITDVAAIFLGFLLPYFGLSSIIGVIVDSQNKGEFDVSTIIMVLVYAAILFIGLKFLSGIKRLLDYLGFELTKDSGKIKMKKRLDLKLEEVTADPSSLKLERISDSMTLKLDGHAVLGCNANSITQKMTIEALYDALRNA